MLVDKKDPMKGVYAKCDGGPTKEENKKMLCHQERSSRKKTLKMAGRPLGDCRGEREGEIVWKKGMRTPKVHWKGRGKNRKGIYFF